MNPNDRLAMRETVNRWGLQVFCLLCDWRGRHRPEKDGRLAGRACPSCFTRTLRSSAWAKRYPERKEAALRELIEQRDFTLSQEAESVVRKLGSSLRLVR